jgi:hypothetical protein
MKKGNGKGRIEIFNDQGRAHTRFGTLELTLHYGERTRASRGCRGHTRCRNWESLDYLSEVRRIF